MRAVIYSGGDCLEILPGLADEFVDAVVTDPPYELGFMGRAWDASGIAYNVDLWKQCFRVLKPGGHLLAFGGTRTSHRLTCAIEDAGFEIRDSIAWLYGSGFPKSLDVSKAIDKADKPDDAKRWAGWGTALKPSHEPVICAMKPHTVQQILDTIGSRLGDLEELWQAPVAGPTIPTGAAVGFFGPTVTWPFGSAERTSWSTVSSWRNCWADLCSRLSMSTIAITSSATTDLKTLCSLLERITRASTIGGQMTADGLRSLVMAADNLFAAAALSSRATLALSAIETATAGTPISRRGAAELVNEPTVVARKPLARGATVAANVLAHGTGALNIDACRVGMSDEDRERLTQWHARYGGGYEYAESGTASGKGLGAIQPPHNAGRWPTNVVLDDVVAAELDEQSGTTTSSARPRRNTAEAHNRTSSMGKSSGDWTTGGHDDSGGASRFFPVFRYQAKAPTRERPKVDGVAHATVKPLELMRWLVRLVTPVDGIVLEPFAGSGTTLEACVLEGMRCIGIEQSADYLPLIAERMARAGLVVL